MKIFQIITIFFVVAFSANAQWVETTSCKKESDVITNMAITYMTNLEYSIAYGMAKAALQIDSNCGCANLIIAAVSSRNKKWGSQSSKLAAINRELLSAEEQAWFDYLNANEEEVDQVKIDNATKFPNSPLLNFIATSMKDFNTFVEFANKFPAYSASAHNMISYGHMNGAFGDTTSHELAMESVNKSISMHEGPNALDSKAEHLASLGKYEEAHKIQLKAVDFATFASPYSNKAMIYRDKINVNEITAELSKSLVDMQTAITDRDYQRYKKYEHDDIQVTTGDSNLGPFYIFTEDEFKSEAPSVWNAFDLSNIKVYFSPDMKCATLTFNADGNYTIKKTGESVDYATRGASIWVLTDDGWKTFHSSWSPRKGKLGIPSK